MSYIPKMYTYQQEQGGPKYSHKTRVGNWLEDMELEELKVKEFMKHRQDPTVSVIRAKTKVSSGLQRVPHTYSSDGRLHFGDKVMLRSKETKGLLAADLADHIESVDEGYCVTTSQSPDLGPCGRTIFVIHRVDDENDIASAMAMARGFPKDVLCYGHKVRLQLNNYYTKKRVRLGGSFQLFLHSRPVSITAYSRKSHKQEACVFYAANFDTVWEVEHNNPNLRFEMKGKPVSANEPIVLKHASTSHHLAACNLPHHNDYGKECEVSCNSYLVLSKGQQLKNETTGKLTPEVSQRVLGTENTWTIVTASDPAAAIEVKAPEEMTIDDVIAEIKQRILERGSNGIRGIGRIFRAMDDNGNHLLDTDDFRWGLIDYGIQISKDDSNEIIRRFDRDGNGMLDFNEFLRFLRGDINATRAAWVKKAYEKLDATCDGIVTVQDVAKLYDASKHPEVIDGKKSAQQVFVEFMQQWDTKQKDGIVTLDQFLDYYSDVSASIDRDDYFAVMMQNAWKL